MVNDLIVLADALSPSLTWACNKNKKLQTNIKIHNEIQKRGLVDKNQLDALVAVYAKCCEFQKAQALVVEHKEANCTMDCINSSLCARRGGPKGSGLFSTNTAHGHSSK